MSTQGRHAPVRIKPTPPASPGGGGGGAGLGSGPLARVEAKEKAKAGVDEGTNMVIKFNPSGQSGDGAGPPARAC